MQTQDSPGKLMCLTTVPCEILKSDLGDRRGCYPGLEIPHCVCLLVLCVKRHHQFMVESIVFYFCLCMFYELIFYNLYLYFSFIYLSQDIVLPAKWLHWFTKSYITTNLKLNIKNCFVFITLVYIKLRNKIILRTFATEINEPECIIRS